MAAAAVVVGLLPPDEGTQTGLSEVKGGETVLILVRKRGFAVNEGPSTFAPDDLFKALVTCDGSVPLAWDLVVSQADAGAFPLDASSPIRCGNRVPLPLTFEITGEGPATVCLLTGSDLPSRERLARDGKAALPDDADCTTIHPVR